MKTKIFISLLTLLFSFFTVIIKAQIISGEREQIIFSPNKIPPEINWSKGFSLKEGGLTTETLPANQSHDVWIQTHAFPIGMSWRPPTAANFKVHLDGSLIETESSSYSNPRIYLRYGGDKINWSTWYEIKLTNEKTTDGLKIYRGEISLPQAARDKYSDLMREWWKTNPVWSSDEHEFCEWLIKKEPDFFVREFPFIGYVQVRIEKFSVNTAQNIKSLTVESNWATGGISSPVKDKSKVRKTTGDKWFFTGKVMQ